ncbi:type II toxin-antitoxin system Phd/YefM family antitoxin [Streptomyces rochei]|uniref:type II toxin-antitoxin system Phd/YefM family antitoxin n=1 Tax=Streptomyces rochei TaxID=1928 RepID=UPI00367BC1EA
MQRMYRTREMQTKAKEILDAAEAGEDVRITRNGKVFKVVLADAEAAEPAEALASTGSGDLLEQLISGQSQTNDLLRELIEQNGNSRDLDKIIEQNGDTRLLDEIIEKSQPAVATRSTVTVQIPERVEDPKPEAPGEPSPEELRTAQEYFGLRETQDGLEATQKGIQSALAHMKKTARDKPDSEEAKVIRMDPASEDRMEFIRLYQIDRYSKALAKRAAGDPRWLGAATPTRF